MYKLITPKRDGRKLYGQTFVERKLSNKKRDASYKRTRRGYNDCY